MPRKCVFNERWLDSDEYKPWIRKVVGDPRSATCSKCLVKIDLSNMGEGALKSHQKGAKHKRLMAAAGTDFRIVDFFAPKSTATSSSPSPDERNRAPSTSTNTPASCAGPGRPTAAASGSSSRQSGIITDFVSRTQTLEAETLWTLKLAKSHWSFKSSEKTDELFTRMFPDSKIAASFHCGERKAAYITTFGLAPHFNKLLSQRVREKDSQYVLLFDESMNHKTQTKQMDVHLRLWHEDKVITRYYTSEFMGHATAEDMLESYHKATDGLDQKSLLQLSMDGPNVNWKFHRLLQAELERDVGSTLINVGSCGLHIVHGAFKKGAADSGWNVDNFLSCLYYLFKDSPARREDICELAGSEDTLLPLKFCKTRWVENVPVAERTLQIMPNIQKYVCAADNKQITRPDNKSFQAVREGCKDPLINCKLMSYISIARQIQGFLTLYQTDRPMMVFLAKDLQVTMKNLMQRFIKPEILSSATTAQKLMSIDVKDKKNHCSYQKVDVGFRADKALKDLLHGKKTSEKQVLEFRMQCILFLKGLVDKLTTKCPLQYKLTRNLACLDPREMAKNDMNEQNKQKLRRTLQVLVDTKHVDEASCDCILDEYSAFLSDVHNSLGDFRDYNYSSSRLDVFLHERMNGRSEYQHLWKVVRMILLLSHGNASVERGFSVNRQVEIDNLAERSYVAKRIICDHIQVVGGLSKVNISKELLAAAAGARQQYHAHLEEQRKQKDQEKKTQKRKCLSDEIEEIKLKKKRVEADAKSLEKAANDFALQAEATGKLTLIAKSNSMRRSAKDKQNHLNEIEKTLDEKLVELKNM